MKKKLKSLTHFNFDGGNFYVLKFWRAYFFENFKTRNSEDLSVKSQRQKKTTIIESQHCKKAANIKVNQSKSQHCFSRHEIAMA